MHREMNQNMLKLRNLYLVCIFDHIFSNLFYFIKHKHCKICSNFFLFTKNNPSIKFIGIKNILRLHEDELHKSYKFGKCNNEASELFPTFVYVSLLDNIACVYYRRRGFGKLGSCISGCTINSMECKLFIKK